MNAENNHTKNLDNSIRTAIALVKQLNHACVGSEHILYGLLACENSEAQRILQSFGLTALKIKNLLAATKNANPNTNKLHYSPNTGAIFQLANDISFNVGVSYVSTEHVLLAILKNPDCYACLILRHLKVDLQQLRSVTEQVVNSTYNKGYNDKQNGTNGDEKRRSEGKNAAEEFGIDLTALARAGKIDPVIGRDEEISRVIRTLSRRTKNSPVLVGEAGVGKSAVVEGLALALVRGEVPDGMKGKRIISLDLSSVLAGAEYRGEFEKRFKNAIESVKKDGTILFIDEIHNLVGAGAISSGSLDAGEILKPALARGELQIIGATTFDEYRKYIEKDPALERRFQPITVDEPSTEATKRILFGIREKFEAHHKVFITDEAIESAVMLSDRYITDRNLPDKAIDVIDDAAARVHLEGTLGDNKIIQKEREFNKLKAEREYALNNNDLTAVDRLENQLATLQSEIQILENKRLDAFARTKRSVTAEDVALVISEWTNVPVTKLGKSESEKLLNLEDELHKRVIGQDRAVSAVARAIRRTRANLKDPKRPNGSFIFVGPTGVGKTELSKALANSVFGSEDSLIRMDMSEYMERSDVSKLIGSAPGLVGHEEEGQLTEKVRRKPYSVVLFDEIEKAHPDIFNLLLQILDEGRLTDSKGRTVDFKNTIIIMTSNIGAGVKAHSNAFGFGNNAESEQDAEDEQVFNALKKHFKPEFLNRIDDVITFRKLTKDECGKIVKLLLSDLKERLKNLSITLLTDVSAEQVILDKGFNDEYGARQLKRVILHDVEDVLSEQIISGNVAKGNIVKLYGDNGSIKYTIL